MGSTNSTNKGSQAIGFRYQEDARAALFNRNMNGVLPAGLYSLGSPVATLGAMVGAFYTGIFIKPLLVLISDNNQDPLTPGVFPRIETTTDYLVPFQTGSLGYVDVSKPYIVLRFGWAEIQSNYMDFCKVSNVMDNTSTDINKMWPNDLVIGQILYDDLGGGNFKLRQTGPIMDFTKASWSFIPGKQAESRELLVQSNDADTTKAYVTGGWLTTGKGKYDVAGTATVAISATPSSAGSAGRIDIVWVDESGVIHVTEGTPSPAPATPAVAPPYNNKKVLAEIRRAGSRSTIEGSEIFNFKTTRDGMLLQGAGSLLNADLWDGIDSGFAPLPRGTAAAASNVFTILNALPLSGQWDFPATCTNTPEGSGASVGIWTIEQTLFQSSGVGTNTGYVIAYRQGVRELWWNTVADGTFGAWKKIWVDETGREVLRTGILTEWQSDVTYALHNGIVRNGQPYRSKISSNFGIDPATDGPVYANWELTGGGSGSSSFLGTAGANIAQFKLVYEDITGKFQIGDNSSQAGSDVIGFATQTVLANASLSVQTSGVLPSVGSGLSPGLRCYLGTAGAITQNESSILIGQCRVSVGIAINTTDILIDILEPVLIYANSTVPTGLGDAMLWTLSSGSLPPTHVPADGRLVSRSLYPDAFTLWGTTFSAGDGVTTFGVIDMSNLTIYNDQGVATGFWAIRMYPLSIVLASQVYGSANPSQITLMANDLSQSSDATGWSQSGTNVNPVIWDPSTLIGINGSLKGGFLAAGLAINDYLAISPVFAVSPFDIGKVWKITFGFKADPTYVDGDFGVFLNDGTNDIPTGIVINGLAGMLQTVQGSVYPSTATSYTIRIKALTNRALTINFWMGKLTIFPQVQIQIPALTSEFVWTPIFQGLGIVTGLDAKYVRVGNKLKGLVNVTTGTPTAVEMQMSLPLGLMTDSLISTLEIAGICIKSTSSAASLYVLQEPSKSYVTFGIQDVSTGALNKILGTANTTGLLISFSFEVTIAQWNSNIVLPGVNEPLYLSNTQNGVNTNGVVGTSYYGIEGAPLVSNTAATTYDIALPREILPNESIRIEVRSVIDKQWIDTGISAIASLNISNLITPYADITTPANSRKSPIQVQRIGIGILRIAFESSLMGIAASSLLSRSWANISAAIDGFDRWRIRIGSAAVSELPVKTKASYSIASFTFTTVDVTQLIPTSKEYDTLLMFNTLNAGAFTIPRKGYLKICLGITLTATGFTIKIFRNGTFYKNLVTLGTAGSTYNSELSIEVNKGDYFDIRSSISGPVVSNTTLQFEMD